MNCCRETTKMGVPPGNRPAVPRDWFRGVPERYVARREGRPYPWSQQVIHEISGLREKCTMFNLLYRLISTHRVLSLRQFIIWPFSKPFFGLLANFCDETERFVELSQS
jgi:hypothetical protein